MVLTSETGRRDLTKKHTIEECRKGVFFTTAAGLVSTLMEVRDEKWLKSYLTKLKKYPPGKAEKEPVPAAVGSPDLPF